MSRRSRLLGPLLLGGLSLAITAGLWQHEREMQQRRLRDGVDAALRQAAARIEQRLAGFEQMLLGLRGLFEASPGVSREAFGAYVDALLAGTEAPGLRAINFAPLLRADQLAAHVAAQRAAGLTDYAVTPAGDRQWYAPVTFAAPAVDDVRRLLGRDPLADPARFTVMMGARDAGRAGVTGRVELWAGNGRPALPGFVVFMPLYRHGAPIETVDQRRAQFTGWVFARFRSSDLVSGLYGEGLADLDIRVYDGAGTRPEQLVHASTPPGAAGHAARFEAQEYIGYAGQTLTVAIRSTPAYERRQANDAATIIAVAGSGLSLLLAALAWLLLTGRERAQRTAETMTRRLHDSAARYRRIVETADEGIWMVDALGCTSFANPKLERMLGVAPDALLGRLWSTFVAPDGPRPAEGASLLDQHELCLQRSDGEVLWVTLSTSPLADEDGRDAGVLAMVTDVTERRLGEARRLALEQQLRQSQKMEAVGTLAGGIAHDFNNILAAILGHVALLQQELGAGHASSPHLTQIALAGGRARSLVQQIVAFSRQQPQQLREQPLRPVVDETLRLLRMTLPALVTLRTDFSDAPLVVRGDATQLQQVLMNLCTNAWHALRGQAGTIEIGLAPAELDAEAVARLGPLAAGPHAHLWVSDNGCGMDEATRQRVFEPFFTTKPVGQGTGLGLAVAHGIVVAHRGAIAVSSAPGQGSRFDLYLPLAEAEPALAPPPLPTPTPAASGRGEHVLYIDDDPVMVVMVEHLLQRAGYRVSGGSDPQQALARLEAAPEAFDIVVTDFNMPGLSGLAVAEAAARLRPGLPVIVTSGYVTDALRAEAQRAGVRWVLQKEFTLEQLGASVRQALDEAAPPRPPAGG